MNRRDSVEFTDRHVIVNRDPDVALRVFFFHHAGGSATSLLPLARLLPSTVESRLFELPGRGLREGEEPCQDFAAAGAVLAGELAPLLDRPAILFGHSLGGLLADAVTREVGGEQRISVILSACPSPARALLQAAEVGGGGRRRSAGQLHEQLRRFGGTPPEVFDDPMLLDRALATLGADTVLLDTYRAPGAPKPAADYQLWFGREDHYDPDVELRRWNDTLAHPATMRTFTGRHFYLFNGSAAALALRDLVAERLDLSDMNGR